MIFGATIGKFLIGKTLGGVTGTMFKSLQIYIVMFLLGLIISLGTLIYFQKQTIQEQVESIADLKVGVQLLEGSNASLIVDVQIQNDAVEAIEIESVFLQQQVFDSARIIEELSADAAFMINNLDNEEVSPVCEEAMQWMLDKAIGELR